MTDAGISVNKKSKVALLCQLVTSKIAACPIPCDGYVWAANLQKIWCEQLGMSVATFRRMISKPPFDRTYAHVDGKKLCLIRIGDPHQKTKREYRNILSAMWRRKVKRPTKRSEFGCIKGLVDVWPEGKSPEIFKLVIDHWPTFVSGMKVHADYNPKYHRYYTFPVLKVMRLFPDVAVEMWIMQQQHKGWLSE
jgi:hypothetical protein